jgi:cell volume regulation protein A
MAKELELPREALVNLIIREGEALPPRGSTELLAGDELHIVARLEVLDEVQRLAGRWRDGPLGEAPLAALPPRGASQVFTVRPWAESDGDPNAPTEIAGVPVATRLRTRRDGNGALLALVDGRYAATGAGLLAVGGRRGLADWCARRVKGEGLSPAERAWWQELAGALTAPTPPRT